MGPWSLRKLAIILCECMLIFFIFVCVVKQSIWQLAHELIREIGNVSAFTKCELTSQMMSNHLNMTTTQTAAKIRTMNITAHQSETLQLRLNAQH